MSTTPPPRVQPRISADGKFQYRHDLGVWEPIERISKGTYTPDGRFLWTGDEWRAVYSVPPFVSASGAGRTAGGVFAAVLGTLAGCGLLAVVAFVAIGAYFASHPLCFSSKGC